MFYISDINHTTTGIKYGVTDTDDGVTEYYSKSDLYTVLNQIGFTKIKGVVHTGSDLKIRVTTPVIEYISNLPNGSNFKLNTGSIIKEYKKLGESGLGNGWLVNINNEQKCLLKAYLIKNKDKISII